MGWRQGVQEKEQERDRLDRSTHKGADPERWNQPSNIGGWKTSADHTCAWISLGSLRSCDVASQTEQGSRNRWPPPPSVTSRSGGCAWWCNFNVSFWSPEEEHQEIARQLWEEKQKHEELTGLVTSLKFKEASLLCENSSLESDIQQQKLKLHILFESHEDHLMQLQKKLRWKQAA